MRPRVKMCCIESVDDATAAVAAGADAIGLVGRGLSGPEVIDDDDVIRDIASTVPAGVATFLLTREQDPDRLAAQVAHCRTSVVQICDSVPQRAYAAVRAAAPAIRILQVIHMTGEEAIARAVAVAPHVDGLVLDSGSPAGPNQAFGGTGNTHDWNLSAAVVQAVDKPVWLAGGLHSGNVMEAFEHVRPFGLDLCSGLRSNGRFDPDRAGEFMRAVESLRGRA